MRLLQGSVSYLYLWKNIVFGGASTTFKEKTELKWSEALLPWFFASDRGGMRLLQSSVIYLYLWNNHIVICGAQRLSRLRGWKKMKCYYRDSLQVKEWIWDCCKILWVTIVLMKDLFIWYKTLLKISIHLSRSLDWFSRWHIDSPFSIFLQEIGIGIS